MTVIGFFINISTGGYEFSYVMIITTIFGAIIGGLVYILALYELENEKGRYLLYLAYIFSIITAIIIILYTMGELSGYINEIIQTEDPQTNFSSITNLYSGISNVSIISIIGNILWVIAVYIPYKRIKDGELIPKSLDKSYKVKSKPNRICPTCKKEIPNDANYCPYCEKKFDY